MDTHNPACQLPAITGSRRASPAAEIRALDSAVTYLRCPVCGSPMSLRGARIACRRQHSFDVARHGYVNLGAGRAGPGTGDSAAMVAARDHFLGRGHYRPLAASVRSLAAQCTDAGLGLVVDLAGGTGYYLAETLDALPGRPGLCIDLSVPALRRASRVHPRAAALAANIRSSEGAPAAARHDRHRPGQAPAARGRVQPLRCVRCYHGQLSAEAGSR